jgi:hypothetical protein
MIVRIIVKCFWNSHHAFLSLSLMVKVAHGARQELLEGRHNTQYSGYQHNNSQPIGQIPIFLCVAMLRFGVLNALTLSVVMLRVIELSVMFSAVIIGTLSGFILRVIFLNTVTLSLA